VRRVEGDGEPVERLAATKPVGVGHCLLAEPCRRPARRQVVIGAQVLGEEISPGACGRRSRPSKVANQLRVTLEAPALEVGRADLSPIASSTMAIFCVCT
jgi:hypothetical protein